MCNFIRNVVESTELIWPNQKKRENDQRDMHTKCHYLLKCRKMIFCSCLAEFYPSGWRQKPEGHYAHGDDGFWLTLP